MRRILVVTNMWPNDEKPYYGLFVKEQVDSIKAERRNWEVDVFNIKGNVQRSYYFTSILAIRRLLKNKQYDLIHIHFGLSGLFLLFLKMKNRPIICTFHGSDISANSKKNLIKRISMQVAKKCSRLLVLNESMVNTISALNVPFDVLPCGVNCDFFLNRDRDVSDLKKIRIGFPSTPERPEKNYSLFERIVNAIKRELLVEVEVVFFKDLTRLQVLENLNTIDVLLMTSNYEGSPQIIKEAMACNTKIVTRDVGDVRWLLDKVQNAEVIEFDADVGVYVNAIKLLLNNEVSNAGCLSREKLFQLGLDHTTVASRLAEIYEEEMNAFYDKN